MPYTVHIDREGEDVAHITGLASPEACLAAMPGYGGQYCCLVYNERTCAAVRYDDAAHAYELYDGRIDRFAAATHADALAHLKACLD